MPTFIMTATWTDQGIRAVKEAPKRAQAARDLAKKLDVEIKQVFLTSGESDLVLILETPNGDNIPKFAMAIGSLALLWQIYSRCFSSLIQDRQYGHR